MAALLNMNMNMNETYPSFMNGSEKRNSSKCIKNENDIESGQNEIIIKTTTTKMFKYINK